MIPISDLHTINRYTRDSEVAEEFGATSKTLEEKGKEQRGRRAEVPERWRKCELCVM